MLAPAGRSLMLLVCRQNADRPQMSAAFFNREVAGRAIGESAGTTPAERVHPVVVEAMREVGIELADATPKLLTPLLQQLADLTVTMGCGDACPLVRAPVIEWDLEDPKDRPLKEVRRIGDDIAFRVGELVANRFADSPAR